MDIVESIHYRFSRGASVVQVCDDLINKYVARSVNMPCLHDLKEGLYEFRYASYDPELLVLNKYPPRYYRIIR